MEYQHWETLCDALENAGEKWDFTKFRIEKVEAGGAGCTFTYLDEDGDQNRIVMRDVGGQFFIAGTAVKGILVDTKPDLDEWEELAERLLDAHIEHDPASPLGFKEKE